MSAGVGDQPKYQKAALKAFIEKTFRDNHVVGEFELKYYTEEDELILTGEQLDAKIFIYTVPEGKKVEEVDARKPEKP